MLLDVSLFQVCMLYYHAYQQVLVCSTFMTTRYDTSPKVRALLLPDTLLCHTVMYQVPGTGLHARHGYRVCNEPRTSLGIHSSTLAGPSGKRGSVVCTTHSCTASIGFVLALRTGGGAAAAVASLSERHPSGPCRRTRSITAVYHTGTWTTRRPMSSNE